MNPLMKIAPQLGAPQPQPQPRPSGAQAAAAVHRFSVIRSAMKGVMEEPGLGVKNLRPKILDAASKILGARVLTMPELMEAIKGLPDDPIQQKKFVEKIFNDAGAARSSVIEHAAAVPEEEGAEAYDAAKQSALMEGLMGHYKNG